MTFRLIDSHCHLHFPAYDADRDAVLARMREAGVGGITIGTALAHTAAGIALAESTEDIWTTVGLHPDHVTSTYVDENEGEVREPDVDEAQLTRLAQSSKKVVAIGECGLDFFRLDEAVRQDAEKKQIEVFKKQLRVAYALDLPLAIHCRVAQPTFVKILQEELTAGRSFRGVFHSFTGTWDEAKELLDLGFFLGVNGIVTFPPKKNVDPALSLQRTIERMPMERLMLETDAPYLAPVPYRGQKNEPTYVEEVAKKIAEIRYISIEEVASITTKNTIELFRLK